MMNQEIARVGMRLRHKLNEELRVALKVRAYAPSSKKAVQGLLNLSDHDLGALGVGSDVAAAIDAWGAL
jgi:hypothetical protein